MSKLFVSINIWLLVWFTPIQANEPLIFANDTTGNAEKFAFYLDKNISDGPYIFYKGDTIIAKWIENDLLVSKIVTETNIDSFRKKFKVFPEYSELENKKIKRINFKQEYRNIEKFVALSDIHGQYDLLIQLLIAHNVVDGNGDWIYGQNHLVINGDIFDRGPAVTECMWFVYNLVNQANEAGGKVHFLIGNHEAMILEQDLRYVNEKYKRTALLMDTTYDQLYSENTLLGKWIRNLPLIISINNVLITHAGISPHFVSCKLTQKKANRLFVNDIIGKPWESIQQDSILEFLAGSEGPLWYRGYFNKDELTEEQLDITLNYFKKDHIITGHTSQDSIISLYNGKVYVIDSSIKLGKTGEVLIYENAKFYRGKLNGEKELL